VSLTGSEENVSRVTHETTSMYNDPLAVQARVPAEVVGPGRTDVEGFTTRPIQPHEVTAVGSFSPTDGDPAAIHRWARSYLQLQDKLGITPTPGSRGAQFQADLKQAMSVAKYGEHDGIGRPLLNAGEVEAAVAKVVARYSPGGDRAPGTSQGAGCATCKDAEGSAGTKAVPAPTRTTLKVGEHTYDLTPGVDMGQPIKFGQRAISPKFSKRGLFKGASVEEVAAMLKNGTLSPDDIPVQYIWVNGEKMVVNNRSLTALSLAGKEPTRAIDMTGNLPEKGPDSLSSVVGRLEEMEGNRPASTIGIRERQADHESPVVKTVPLPERQPRAGGPPEQ
jgi:hypothetical protein